MASSNVPLLSSEEIPSAVQFTASKEFQTHTEQKAMDSAFLGYKRRPWILEKMRRNPHNERELLETLLSRSTDVDMVTECANKLIDEDIGFRDLASLSAEDLEQLGWTSDEKRKDLLQMFAQLPNQDPSYEYICNLPEGETFNNSIVGSAANHLMAMRSSLAATNYKMQVMPPEDIPIDRKYYASRFALDALQRVLQITDELAKDFKKMQKMNKITSEPNEKKFSSKWTYIYFTIGLGIAFASWWWFSRNSNIPKITINS